MEDVDHGGVCACVDTGYIWELSVLSTQLCWEPKIILKNRAYCKKGAKESMQLTPISYSVFNDIMSQILIERPI